MISIYFNRFKRKGATPKPKKLVGDVCHIHNFEDWLETMAKLKRPKNNQVDYVAIDGEIAVDKLMRFEHLEEDWKIVAEAIKLDTPLPHINGNKHEHYSTYYCEHTIEIVSNMCGIEIAKFGFKFEDKR